MTFFRGKILGFILTSIAVSQAHSQMLCQKQIDESTHFLGQGKVTANAYGVKNTHGQWLSIHQVMNSKTEIKALTEEFEKEQIEKLADMRKHLLLALHYVSTNPNSFAKKILEQVPVKGLSVDQSSGHDFVKAVSETASENELLSVSRATSQLFGGQFCEDEKMEEKNLNRKREDIEAEYKACIEKSLSIEASLADFHKAYEARRTSDAVPALIKYQRPTGSDDLKISMRAYPIVTIEATWISKYNHAQTIDINIESCQYRIARYNQQTTQYEETSYDSLPEYLKQYYKCTLPLRSSRNQWACGLLYQGS